MEQVRQSFTQKQEEDLQQTGTKSQMHLKSLKMEVGELLQLQERMTKCVATARKNANSHRHSHSTKQSPGQQDRPSFTVQ